MARGRIRDSVVYVCDFETTVYDNQKFTEVWASAIVELYTEDVAIHHSLDETFNFFKSLKKNVIAYYHNLKFDGSFILYYLLKTNELEPALVRHSEAENDVSWIPVNKMQNGTYRYSITDDGQWYSIIIKTGNKLIEFRDSLKLLPFSVNELGKAFSTKKRKLKMEYKGFRYAGCEITAEEQEYIKNDVLVVKEAIEFMYNNKHTKLTIGACCLSEFKTMFTKEMWESTFPNLYEKKFNSNIHGSETVGEYIRKSYRGGWCYVVKGKENKVFHNGLTADVNSLYPSVMHSESGSKYPYGVPTFWTGNYIPKEACGEKKYYFLRFRCRFYIKKNKLPFVQVKNSTLYDGTEMLETSDVWIKEKGCYSSCYYDFNNKLKKAVVELTMTEVDYKLFLEHYNVADLEILDGCWFNACVGIFDEYIDKYKQIKMNSKGAMRTLAKLFLNNLYGKLATSIDSSFKLATLKDDVLTFTTVREYEKSPGYIPMGTAITSYARNFTIRAAQANYYGANKRGFIYADTDSIHCDLNVDELKGIKIHNTNFCCWKIEACWTDAIFARQKTYIEKVVAVDLEAIDIPFYNIKCAGLPDRCKDLFLLSLLGFCITESREFTDEEKKLLQLTCYNDFEKVSDFNEPQINFLSKTRSLEDFKIGLEIPGKLMAKKIPGGTVLLEGLFSMRKKVFSR